MKTFNEWLNEGYERLVQQILIQISPEHAMAMRQYKDVLDYFKQEGKSPEDAASEISKMVIADL